jgi:hypothetical protein
MSAGVAVLATGCAPLVGVKRLSPRDAGRSFTSNVLSTDDLSDATRIALRRHDLTELFDNQPAAALAQLHTIVLSEGDPDDDLFALAEASFLYAGRGGKQPYYLAAAVTVSPFSFPRTRRSDRSPWIRATAGPATSTIAPSPSGSKR